MQSQHPLFSWRKQSQYQRFCEEPEDARWNKRDSTSEYDTDLNELLVKLTKDLQEHIDSLHTLRDEQPLEEESAALVQMVMPVESGMPAPSMEVDGATVLQTTMGPGWLDAAENMPPIFLEHTEEEEPEAEDVVEMDESEQPEADLIDDEGEFDEDREHKLIVSLTHHHNSPIAWWAQCITLWRQIAETAAEVNQLNSANQQTIREQYPDLFQYLAYGGPEDSDSVLTTYEIETGRADLKDMIARRAVIHMAHLDQARGHQDLDPVLEAYITAGNKERSRHMNRNWCRMQGPWFCTMKRAFCRQ